MTFVRGVDLQDSPARGQAPLPDWEQLREVIEKKDGGAALNVSNVSAAFSAPSWLGF